jgi:hypothetical protein
VLRLESVCAILKDSDRITDLDWGHTDSGRNTDLKLPRVDRTGARLLPFAPYVPFRGHYLALPSGNNSRDKAQNAQKQQ